MGEERDASCAPMCHIHGAAVRSGLDFLAELGTRPETASTVGRRKRLPASVALTAREREK